MNEKILCAAIHFNDGPLQIHQPKNIQSGFVVAGRRHHNCFSILKLILGDKMLQPKSQMIQGFLTSEDRFVDRKEAAQIAYAQKQISEPIEILISEDLY